MARSLDAIAADDETRLSDDLAWVLGRLLHWDCEFRIGLMLSKKG
jgi:hypothetical protein